jgi:hypothetical protein
MSYDPDLINRIMEVVKHDLDPQTIEIVNEMLYDGHRLSVIRDAFMENRDALAVKMIRDLDPLQGMELLPFSTSVFVEPSQSAQVTARPQRVSFRPRYLILARETAEAVDINDIKIGNRSQMSQAGDVPGEMFGVDIPAGSFDRLDELARDLSDGPPLTPVFQLRVGMRALERMPLPLDFETAQTTMDVTVVFTNISNKPVRIRGAFVGAVEGHTPNYWSMHTAAIAAASAHAQGHVPEGLQVPDADGVAQIIEHVHETMLGTDQGPPPDPPDPST